MVSHRPDPCVLVVLGATGDLARKKLFPALARLAARGLLPAGFTVAAVARRPWTQESFRQEVVRAVQEAGGTEGNDIRWQHLLTRITYLQTDIRDPQGYARLRSLLAELEERGRTGGNSAFYLALAPEFFGPVVRNLRQHGLASGNGPGWRRVVIEKPFGWDLESARQLNRELVEVFPERDIYRIDHYLGKEMIQNIMVIRFANAFFEPVWNSRWIDHVQISSLETGGIENRGGYYERAGALRDMLQNHMLQLVSMIAMEPPTSLATADIREEKVKVLRSLQLLTEENIRKNAVRGQYGEGFFPEGKVPGYRQEKAVAPHSATETFVALKLHIDNFRWAGVPFYLRTGKRLARRYTEIAVQFKALPQVLYFKEYGELSPNLLVIRIQPQEGVFLRLNAKRPGTDNFIVPIKLDFCQNCEIGVNSPEAYERLLLDVMRGDPTLFTGWEEVEYAWRFVDPLAAAWARAVPSFPNYPAGTWGPEDAGWLMRRDGRQWAEAGYGPEPPAASPAAEA
ncbi:MAG: glucose-6-phosphate dehydrogenase [Clostridia bacterium]|nr:MAG: glucose-6-phosphate dehydrogenase [Clostridia bacterium]